jgi:hypothetical protein
VLGSRRGSVSGRESIDQPLRCRLNQTRWMMAVLVFAIVGAFFVAGVGMTILHFLAKD